MKIFCQYLQDTFVSLGGSQPTRESFLDALSHIDAILIRATHHSIMASATLRDLTMDTAVPQDTGLGRAMIVEQCSCPQGYAGLSCQVRHYKSSLGFISISNLVVNASLQGTPLYRGHLSSGTPLFRGDTSLQGEPLIRGHLSSGDIFFWRILPFNM